MSIPKTIHYCWFGRNPKPKLAKKCIKSWKKHCPEYEIIEWNEDNFDISSCPLYVRQAYEAQKWAFVTDYVRLKVIYDNGGIYLDTDVQLIKSLDGLLKFDAYFGFEDGNHISTGLGFGAIKNNPIVQEIMDDYNDINFILADGTYDLLPCPVRNTNIFLRHGLIQNNTFQIINNCAVLPSDYLCPIEYETGKKNITDNTLSIHHFSASWQAKEVKKQHEGEIKRIKHNNLVHDIKHFPNFIMKKIMGNDNYNKLKGKLKK